jgi:hypothetical protein
MSYNLIIADEDILINNVNNIINNNNFNITQKVTNIISFYKTQIISLNPELFNDAIHGHAFNRDVLSDTLFIKKHTDYYDFNKHLPEFVYLLNDYTYSDVEKKLIEIYLNFLSLHVLSPGNPGDDDILKDETVSIIKNGINNNVDKLTLVKNIFSFYKTFIINHNNLYLNDELHGHAFNRDVLEDNDFITRYSEYLNDININNIETIEGLTLMYDFFYNSYESVMVKLALVHNQFSDNILLAIPDQDKYIEDPDSFFKTINIRIKIFGKRIGFSFKIPDPKKLIEFIGNIPNFIKDAAEEVFDRAIEPALDFFKEDVLDPAIGFLEDAYNEIEGVVEDVVSEVASIAGDVADFGEDIFEGLKDIGENIADIPSLLFTIIKFPVELIIKLVDLIKQLPKLFGNAIKFGVKFADLINYLFLILPGLIIVYFIANRIIDFEKSYR